jgi:hypothetical protein
MISKVCEEQQDGCDEEDADENVSDGGVNS